MTTPEPPAPGPTAAAPAGGDRTHPSDTPSYDATTTDVTVYWRPGCPFCSRLFRQLERAEVAHRRVNIWDDPEAAAVVRSIARGNETVPTVVVGGPGGLGLVNPDVSEILAAAGRA